MTRSGYAWPAPCRPGSVGIRRSRTVCRQRRGLQTQGLAGVRRGGAARPFVSASVSGRQAETVLPPPGDVQERRGHMSLLLHRPCGILIWVLISALARDGLLCLGLAQEGGDRAIRLARPLATALRQDRIRRYRCSRFDTRICPPDVSSVEPSDLVRSPVVSMPGSFPSARPNRTPRKSSLEKPA